MMVRSLAIFALLALAACDSDEVHWECGTDDVAVVISGKDTCEEWRNHRNQLLNSYTLECELEADDDCTCEADFSECDFD